MTGTETWEFVAPILIEFLNATDREEWIEVYTNVFNGLKKLDDIDKLKNEIKNMKRRAGSFLNSDYATGYISALSTIEGLLS